MLQAAHRYKLEPDEIAIICCVVTESTRDLFENCQFSHQYAYEDKALPMNHRRPVAMKSIHIALGMSRETVRRKLLKLVEKGFLIRRSEGFIFPEQTDGWDYTKELRMIMAKSYREMRQYEQRLDQPGKYTPVGYPQHLSGLSAARS